MSWFIDVDVTRSPLNSLFPAVKFPPLGPSLTRDSLTQVKLDAFLQEPALYSPPDDLQFNWSSISPFTLCLLPLHVHCACMRVHGNVYMYMFMHVYKHELCFSECVYMILHVYALV